MAGGIIGRLQAYLGLNTTQFEGGIKKGERDVKRFGQTVQTSLSGAVAQATGFGRTFAAGIAGGLVGAAFAGLSSNIEETIRGVAQIGDEAKRAGMGIEPFQQWGYVAKQNRIEIDAVVDGFKELNLRADEFIVTGSGSGADAFKRLGFDASELKRRLEDPSELMLEIIGRMEGIDAAAQIRIFDELLGGQGGERFVELLAQGEGKIRDTMNRAKEMGAVLDEEAIAKAAELNRQFSDLQAFVGTHLRQAIVDFGQDIKDIPLISFGDAEYDLRDLIDLMGRVRDRMDDMGAGSGMEEGLRDLQSEAANLAGELMDLSIAAQGIDGSEELEAMAFELQEIHNAFVDGSMTGEEFARKIGEVEDRAADAVAALGDMDGAAFDAVQTRLGTFGDVLRGIIGLAREATAAMPGDEGPIGERFGPVQEVWRNPAVDLPDRASQRPEQPSFEASENIAYGVEDKKAGGGGKSEKDKKDEFKSALASIQEETAALEAEAVALLAVTSAQQDYGDVVDYARRRAELMHAAQKVGMEITPELKRQIDDLARSYTTAGMNAEEAADRLQRIEEAGEKGADAITDIFLSLRNGADGFKDALGNLLLQIAQIQMQKAIMGGLGGLGGKGGAGVSGWLGGLLTLPGNAGGTHSWRGGITRVNEIGGEIMNLPNGTQIIPHDISKRMVDQQTSGGGPSGPMAMTFDFRGTTGDKALDEKFRAAGQAWMQQVPGYMENRKKRTG